MSASVESDPSSGSESEEEFPSLQDIPPSEEELEELEKEAQKAEELSRLQAEELLTFTEIPPIPPVEKEEEQVPEVREEERGAIQILERLPEEEAAEEEGAASYFFTLENAQDPSRRRQITVAENVPLKEALLLLLEQLEDEPSDILLRTVRFSLDSPDSGRTIVRDSPESYVEGHVGIEIPRKIYYRIVPEEETLPPEEPSLLPIPEVPSVAEPPQAPERPPQVEEEEEEQVIRLPKKVKKPSPAPEEIRKPIRYKTTPKEERVTLVRHATSIVNANPNSERYQEAQAWLQVLFPFSVSEKFFLTSSAQEMVATDPSIDQAMRSYFKYKINKTQGRGQLPWIQALQQIEDWAEGYRSLERYAKRKRKEATPKKETVFKVKYDPKTGVTKVKESKHFKALRRAAEENIRQFEKSYPEYFERSRLEDRVKKLRRSAKTFAAGIKYPRLSLMKSAGEELLSLKKTFAQLEESIRGEEEEDIFAKSFLLFSIFVITEKPLSRKEIYDIWKSIFTRVSPSARQIIDELLKDESLFTKKGSKYSLTKKALTALALDPEFMDYLDYVRQVLNQEEIAESELENEERLAKSQQEEITKIRKDISNLPLSVLRSVAKIAGRLGENATVGREKRWNVRLSDELTGATSEISEPTALPSDAELAAEVKRSKAPKGGKYGLFVIRDFAPDENIVPYEGEILTRREFEERYADRSKAQHVVPITLEHRGRDYSFYVDSSDFTSSLGRYVKDYKISGRKSNAAITYESGSDVWDDSGSEPILESVDIWLQATSPIKSGGEVFLDYRGEQERPPSIVSEIAETISQPALQPITEQITEISRPITEPILVSERPKAVAVKSKPPTSEEESEILLRELEGDIPARKEEEEQFVPQPPISIVPPTAADIPKDYDLMRRLFGYSPIDTKTRQQLEDVLREQGFESFYGDYVRNLIPDLRRAYESSATPSSPLVSNMLDNIRQSRIKKLLANPNLRELVRAAFLAYSLQGLSFDRDASEEHRNIIRRYAEKSLRAAPASELAPFSGPGLENAKEIRDFYKQLLQVSPISASLSTSITELTPLLQHELPAEQRLLEISPKKLSEAQKNQIKLALSYPPPSPIDIVAAYLSEVKGLNFDQRYLDQLQEIIQRFNSRRSGSLPDISQPAWGFSYEDVP